MRKKQNKILLEKLWKISEGKFVESSIPKVQYDSILDIEYSKNKAQTIISKEND